MPYPDGQPTFDELPPDAQQLILDFAGVLARSLAKRHYRERRNISEKSDPVPPAPAE